MELHQSHAMSIRERYNAPLRSTFFKLQEIYGMKPLSEEANLENLGSPGRPRKTQMKSTRQTTVDDEYLLDISVMCVNSTVGHEGICPTLLIFGAMPNYCSQVHHQLLFRMHNE